MSWWRKAKIGDCDPSAAKAAVANAARSKEIAADRRVVVDDLTAKLHMQGAENNFIMRLNMHVARRED